MPEFACSREALRQSWPHHILDRRETPSLAKDAKHEKPCLLGLLRLRRLLLRPGQQTGTGPGLCHYLSRCASRLADHCRWRGGFRGEGLILGGSTIVWVFWSKKSRAPPPHPLVSLRPAQHHLRPTIGAYWHRHSDDRRKGAQAQALFGSPASGLISSSSRPQQCHCIACNMSGRPGLCQATFASKLDLLWRRADAVPARHD